MYNILRNDSILRNVVLENGVQKHFNLKNVLCMTCFTDCVFQFMDYSSCMNITAPDFLRYHLLKWKFRSCILLKNMGLKQLNGSKNQRYTLYTLPLMKFKWIIYTSSGLTIDYHIKYNELTTLSNTFYTQWGKRVIRKFGKTLLSWNSYMYTWLY